MYKLKSIYLTTSELGCQLSKNLGATESNPVNVFDLLDHLGAVCPQCKKLMSPLEPSDTEMYCNRCWKKANAENQNF